MNPRRISAVSTPGRSQSPSKRSAILPNSSSSMNVVMALIRGILATPGGGAKAKGKGKQASEASEDALPRAAPRAMICPDWKGERKMALVRADGLSKRYGDREVFSGVSFQIGRGERIALVGPNGSGKTTLLRIIAGEEEPTSGRLTRARSLRVGYLPQEPYLELDPGAGGGGRGAGTGIGTGGRGERTVFAEALGAFDHLRRLEEELRQLEEGISRSPEREDLLQRYDELREEFERAGGYRYEALVRQVLVGLGLPPEEWDRPLAQLSGGERARVALAKLILEEPELLLLDEPTNHLDLAALEWLEDYLEGWRGSYILVSHDRRFLDRLAEKTWELEGGRLTRYPGNYTKYLLLKREQEERHRKLYERQQEEIARLEEFIRRTRAGQKHGQAKDREKKLARMERLERPRPPRRIRLRFELTRPSGQEVLTLRGVTIGYPGRALFRCPDLVLERGERVALIGPNGSGKTTLLRTILGELPPLEGTLIVGHHVELGYFAQIQEQEARSERTIFELLLERRGETPAGVRQLLGQFLFPGEEAFKRLKDLSGGELSRVALARLAQTKGNFLLLDEPTNHLDLGSQEVLQEALEEYEGTVLLVSHDRYLIDRIATQVWEIRDGWLHIYHGGYSYWRRRRAEEQGRGQEPAEPKGKAKAEARAKGAAQQLERKRELNELELERQEAELLAQVEALEEELAQLEEALAQASYSGDHQRIAELNSRYKRGQRELEELLERWDRLLSQEPRGQQRREDK